MPVLQIRVTDEQMDELRERAGVEKPSAWARDFLFRHKDPETFAPEIESWIAERCRHKGLGRHEYLEALLGAVRTQQKRQQADPKLKARIEAAMRPLQPVASGGTVGRRPG